MATCPTDRSPSVLSCDWTRAGSSLNCPTLDECTCSQFREEQDEGGWPSTDMRDTRCPGTKPGTFVVSLHAVCRTPVISGPPAYLQAESASRLAGFLPASELAALEGRGTRDENRSGHALTVATLLLSRHPTSAVMLFCHNRTAASLAFSLLSVDHGESPDHSSRRNELPRFERDL